MVFVGLSRPQCRHHPQCIQREVWRVSVPMGIMDRETDESETDRTSHGVAIWW